MKFLISSGGSKVPLDKVRDITNMSHGTFASRIATSTLIMNHDVLFLRAKDSKSPFTLTLDLNRDYTADALTKVGEVLELYEECKYQYEEFQYRDFEDYASQLERCCKVYAPDVVVLAAAISDYGVLNPVAGKARSTAEEMVIQLHRLPKLISQIKTWAPNTFLVGFKLLVDSTEQELIEAAKSSIGNNGCNLVVANDLRDIRAGAHKIAMVGPYGYLERFYDEPTD